VQGVLFPLFEVVLGGSAAFLLFGRAYLWTNRPAAVASNHVNPVLLAISPEGSEHCRKHSCADAEPETAMTDH